MVTGEYTTGFVGGMSGLDKKVGVVGLTLFDLRRRQNRDWETAHGWNLEE